MILTQKEILSKIGVIAEKQGLKAWAVGGIVRDGYLGKEDTKDIDITVEGPADKLADYAVKTWGGKKAKFEAYGTHRVSLKNGINLDFVRSRKELYVTPAALPSVSPGTLEEDLFRRDFTSNAWAVSILPKNFGLSFDPYGAQKDIDRKLIRVLHDKSFQDDPTRLFRAVRFAGRFDWQIESKTDMLIKDAVARDYPSLLTRPRIRMEFIKILNEEHFERIVKLMDAYGLSKYITPQFKWDARLARARNLVERLGLISCIFAECRPEWVLEMQLRKEAAQEIIYACEVYAQKRAPLKKLTDSQKNIIHTLLPNLPAAALEPCLITGGEIGKMGFKGASISTLISRVQKLQWEGKIKTKEEAKKEILRLTKD